MEGLKYLQLFYKKLFERSLYANGKTIHDARFTIFS